VGEGGEGYPQFGVGVHPGVGKVLARLWGGRGSPLGGQVAPDPAGNLGFSAPLGASAIGRGPGRRRGLSLFPTRVIHSVFPMFPGLKQQKGAGPDERLGPGGLAWPPLAARTGRLAVWS